MRMGKAGLCLGVWCWLAVPGYAYAVSQLEIGILTCEPSASFDSSTEISLICDFRPTDGPIEAYSATITELDLQVDEHDRVVWSVSSKRPLEHSGGLAGEYSRSPSGALLGGRKGAFTLEPKDGRGLANSLAEAISKLVVIGSN